MPVPSTVNPALNHVFKARVTTLRDAVVHAKADLAALVPLAPSELGQAVHFTPAEGALKAATREHILRLRTDYADTTLAWRDAKDAAQKGELENPEAAAWWHEARVALELLDTTPFAGGWIGAGAQSLGIMLGQVDADLKPLAISDSYTKALQSARETAVSLLHRST